MEIFIGWSGKYSKSMAIFLKQWLEDLFQGSIVFNVCSNEKPGRIWWNDLEDMLKLAKGAILCLTQESVSSNWLEWEASQIYAKKIGFIIPYCLDDISLKEVSSPIRQFHMLSANKRDTWNLVRKINEESGYKKKDEKSLSDKFNSNWYLLSERFEEISKELLIKRNCDSHLQKFESAVLTLSNNYNKALEIVNQLPELNQEQRYIIALCGSAAIGKSTFADLLAYAIKNKTEHSVTVLPTDAYALSRAQKKEMGLQGYEPDSHNLQELRKSVWSLINGKKINIKPYQHEDGRFGKSRSIEPAKILIVEGVYSFDPMNYYKLESLPENNKFVGGCRIYLYAEPGKAQELKFAADVTKRNKTVEEAFDKMNVNYESYNEHIKKKFYKFADQQIEVKGYWLYS